MLRVAHATRHSIPLSKTGDLEILHQGPHSEVRSSHNKGLMSTLRGPINLPCGCPVATCGSTEIQDKPLLEVGLSASALPDESTSHMSSHESQQSPGNPAGRRWASIRAAC